MIATKAGILSVLAVAGLWGQETAMLATAEGVARLLQPGAETTLEVRVYGPDGHPMEGRDVVFAAPLDTTLGQWAGAAPDTPLLVRAVTDSDGYARAVWRAGQTLGPYFLSALSDGDYGHQQFAVTNVSEPPEPLDIDAARAQLTQDHAVEEPWSRLYGPFYLPAGWTLRGEGAALFGAATERTIDTNSWLFWIDPNPRARWSHPSTFLLMDAATGAITTLDQNWWPQVLAPDAAAWMALFPPYRLLDGLLPDPPPGPQPVPLPDPEPVPLPGPEPASVIRLTPGHLRFGAKPDPNACAILFYGADENGMRRDVAKVRAFLHDELMIPDDHLITNTDADGNLAVAKPSDVQRMAAELCNKGCQRIYVYISSHGASGTFALANENNHDGNLDEDSMTYDGFIKLIQPCGGGVPTDLIIDTCSAGTSIRLLQGQGVDGNVYTASSLTGASEFNYWGGFFIDGLIDSWRADESDRTGDGVDLDEAYRHLLVNGSKDQLAGGPMTSRMYGAGLPSIDLPDINIDDPSDGNQNPVTIVVRRPEGAIGPLRGSVSIDLDGGAVATVLDGSEPLVRQIQLDAETNEIEVQIAGLDPGTTFYKALLTDDQQKQFRGQADIRVGAGFTITPGKVETTPGQTVTFTVTRDPALAQSEGLVHIDFDTVDPTSADVAEPDLTVTFQPGETEKTFQVHTYRAGLALLTATQRGTNRVQQFEIVVSGFSPLPNPAHTLVGDHVTVDVQRYGGAIQQGAQLTIAPADAASASIAKIDVNTLQFQAGQDKLSVHAIGLAEGEARYVFTDAAGNSAILRIVVEPKQVGCLMQGTFNAQFTAISGFGHVPFFNVGQVVLRFAAAGAIASLSSNHTNVPSGSGPFDAATCSVPLIRGTATLAGYPGIEFEYRNVHVDSATGRIQGQYAAGTNSLLPGGYPIVYDFTGALQP